MVQVDKADVDAALAEAEARYDRELAEAAEEQAALDAEADAKTDAEADPEGEGA